MSQARCRCIYAPCAVAVLALAMFASGCAHPEIDERPALGILKSWTQTIRGVAHRTDRAIPRAGLGTPELSEAGSQAIQPAVFQAQAEETLPNARILPPEAAVDSEAELFAIDLTTALRLAGANNLQIGLAYEKLVEAQARYDAAKALWLPTLSGGIGYNKHEGRIQNSGGNVFRVSRSSLFVGGGGSLSGLTPLTGGTNGPVRLAVDFSIAQGIFEPLAKKQLVRVAVADKDAAFSQALYRVALAYLDLVESKGRVVEAEKTLADAQKLYRLIQDRVEVGAALPADASRAKTVVERLKREVLQHREAQASASAELARLLVIDPAITLEPIDTHAVPVELVDAGEPLPKLIAKALASRPELEARNAFIDATLLELEHQRWRPWIPHLYIGASSGGFGGSGSSSIENFGGRLDIDALLVWQVRNLGAGERAAQRIAFSKNIQAAIQAAQMRDRIASEVAAAWHRVQLRRRQVTTATEQLKAAQTALQLNLEGVMAGTLRAAEAIQAIEALAESRAEQLAAIIDFNRAQFELLYAIGS